MSSKLKLDYQFNTAANLEIEYAAGRWVRTTANWFRAFIGPRRIDGQLYVGPIYYEGTNGSGIGDARNLETLNYK